MNFKAVVKKVVRTEAEDETSWRVVMESGDGHRVSLSFGSEEETMGYAPGATVQVDVKNPQQTLKEAS